MDNQTAKHILSVYRPSGQDADDLRIREALEHCRNDPEMRAWLEDQTRFDRSLARALQSLHGPAEGRREILAAASFASDHPDRRPLSRWLLWSAAALLALTAAYFVTLPLTSGGRGDADTAPTLAALASQALPLDLRSKELDEIQAWLRAKDSPFPETLPPQLSAAAGLAGCRVLEGEQHEPVSLICFKMDGEFVHLFIFEKSHPLAPSHDLEKWRHQDDWHLYGWTDDRFAYALATRNDSETLRKRIHAGQVSSRHS